MLGELTAGGYRTTTMFAALSHCARCWVFPAALLALLLAGCPRSDSPQQEGPPKNAQPLTLLVVDDPPLGQAIAREWRSRTEEELTVREVTSAEVLDASRLPGDVIVFPAGLAGDLAERGLIVPLDDSALAQPEYDRRDIFDHVRLREVMWGDRTLAVPLGSPQFLLCYRRDVLERVGSEPPATWADYQRLVEKVADRESLGDLAPPDDAPWHATLESLAGHWAAHTLLARAAAYAMHRDQVSALFDGQTMEPLIDRPPYVRALGDLVAAAKAGAFGKQLLTPDSALRELRSGHAAMAIAWPAPVPPAGETSQTEFAVADEQLGFALLPGAPMAYSLATKGWETRDAEDSPRVALLGVTGRMAAVTGTTPDVRRVQGLLVWLASREVSNIVGPHSPETTLFRTSQLPDAARWTGLPPEAAGRYAETLAQAMVLPRAHPGVRLPGRAEYLESLSQAVRRAVAGEQEPRAALEQAADEWRTITERIGTERQQRANARSLGQESL